MKAVSPVWLKIHLKQYVAYKNICIFLPYSNEEITLLNCSSRLPKRYQQSDTMKIPIEEYTRKNTDLSAKQARV